MAKGPHDDWRNISTPISGRVRRSSSKAYYHGGDNPDHGGGGSSFYGNPFFGKTNTQVLVQEGSHAFFHCPVHNLGNQTVNEQ